MYMYTYTHIYHTCISSHAWNTHEYTCRSIKMLDNGYEDPPYTETLRTICLGRRTEGGAKDMNIYVYCVLIMHE